MDYKKKYEELYERISNLVRDYDCVSGLIDVREELKSMLNESQESEDEKIRTCIGMCLTDANEQRFKYYNTSLKECLDWL